MVLLFLISLAVLSPATAEAQRVRNEWDGVRAWVRTGQASAMYEKMLGFVMTPPDVDAFTYRGRSYGIPQAFYRDGSTSGSSARWFDLDVERREGGRFRCFARWDADAFYFKGEREGNGRPEYVGFSCRPS